MITGCLDPVELARIGRGVAAGSCPPEWTAHIEDCPRCRQFLDRCAKGGFESSRAPGASEAPASGVVPRVEGFTIERELGRGAMGVVYLAHRDAPRRQVALKLLPGGRSAGARERRQWLREAEAAALVRHPHVVTLYEACVTDDWFLLALEYVPGGTLADRLTGPVAPRSAAKLVETIARAVHQIHQCGLLHLDLKPSNILLDGDAAAGWEGLVPKVTDFGIARAADASSTDTGGAGPGGTPSYMAPEQISKPRREMTPAADIHGLGAILYQMLTGRPPYHGTTILETIDQLQRQEPIPPRRFSAAIPRDLETICLKCLYKDPERRYASAEAMAADLDRWLDERPIAARPASAVEKSWRWCRRRPVIAALTAALLLTLSVGLVTLTLFWRRAEENFRLTTEMLGEAIDLSVGGEDGLPRIMTPGRMIPLLERHRKRLLALRVSGPDELSVARQLEIVEYRLDRCLMEAARHEDARIMGLEALARLDMLIKRHPQDVGLRVARSNRLLQLAAVGESLGNGADLVAYLTRAIESCEEAMSRGPAPGIMPTLLKSRRRLAWALYERGDHERAGALFAASHDLAEGASPGMDSPGQQVWRLTCHLDWRLFLEGARSTPSGAKWSEPSAVSCRLASLASPADTSQSPPQWARTAAQRLHATPVNDGDPARRAAEDGLAFEDVLNNLASRVRRKGETEKAHRISEKMRALAEHYLAMYPDQPSAHLMKAIAYEQISKEGWEPPVDCAAIEKNLALALVAAQEASRLAPGSEVAQRQVDHIQRKLAGIRAKR